MKNIAFLLLFLFSLFACNKEKQASENQDETYIVDIDIIQPEENTSIAIGDNLPVEVRFSRQNNLIIHNVLIQALNNEEEVVSTIRNKHEHVSGEVTFKQVDAFTASEAGTFTLKVETTNLEGEEPNTVTRSFTVN